MAVFNVGDKSIDLIGKLKIIHKHAKRTVETVSKLTTLNLKYGEVLKSRDDELCQYRTDIDAKDRLIKTCKQSIDHHHKTIAKLRKDLTAKISEAQSKLAASQETIEQLRSKLSSIDHGGEAKRQLKFTDTDKIHRISLSSLNSTGNLAISAISNNHRPTAGMFTNSDIIDKDANMFAGMCSDAFVTFKQCTTIDLVNPLDNDC